MPQLILAFDVVNQSIVKYKDSSSRLPPFRQGVYDVRIYLVTPNPEFVPGSPTYLIYDFSAYDGIRVGFWSDSTGTLNDSTEFLLALTPHIDWTATVDDDGDECFTGQINTFTSQMADWIGSAAYREAYFAVNLVAGTTLHPVYDHKLGTTNVVVNSATDDGSGDLPLDMTEEVPTIVLPVHLLGGDGRIYALTETSPGVVEWVWINP